MCCVCVCVCVVLCCVVLCCVVCILPSHGALLLRISIANADLAIASGNIEQALAALKAVAPDHPHYTQARKKMADIFLKHQKNKEQYIQCYRYFSI